MRDAADTLFMGVDIGTYETKGLIVNGFGDVVASASREHNIITPADGRAEHEAESVWWQGFVEVSRLLTSHPSVHADLIVAVGCSGIGPCVLPVDEQLNPLRPAILYGIDTRATTEIDQLNDLLGSVEIFERAGNYLTSQSAGPKIAWLKYHEPEIHDKTAYFLTCSSFLVARLTGKVLMDHATAGYYHPLYNLTEQRWDLRGCEDFIREEQLPSLAWTTDIAGQVSSQASQTTGIPAGSPVVVGTSDAPAEAIASGVVDAGDMMLMYGSSTFMIRMLDAPATSEILWSAPYVFPESYALTAGTSTAGTLTHWLADILGLRDSAVSAAKMFEDLVEMAEKSPAGANGLLTLPYLSGERTPLHDPEARGLIAGLTLRHTRADIVRSAFEGVAHSIADALNTYVAEGMELEHISAVGGGTKNPIWTQVVSDICDTPQHIVENNGACFGDAALAALAIGYLKDRSEVSAWTRVHSTVTPDSACYKRYRADHEVFKSLYKQTDMLMHYIAGHHRSEVH